MNAQTITMDPAEARDRLRSYKRALRRRADDEYAAALAGYGALAEGTPVLQYGPAIAAAPRDKKGRPMLAVARADRKQVELRWGPWTSVAEFSTTRISWAALHDPETLLYRYVPMGERPGDQGFRSAYGYALVPMVPADVLERANVSASRLREHLILWEVEEWADRRIGAQPDRDPYLLRPIHGDLCAVVAEWDLTELERAVMAGRAMA